MKKLIAFMFTIGLIFIIGFNLYKYFLSSDIPYDFPKVNINYENRILRSSQGESTWIYEKGGNSNITGPSYDVGEKLEAIVLSKGGYVDVFFKTKPIKCPPKEVLALMWKDRDNKEEYEVKMDEKHNYKIKLPEKEGEYIFEIIGSWGEKNNTSNILKILIE